MKAGTGLGTEAGSWRGPGGSRGRLGHVVFTRGRQNPLPQQDNSPQAWRERAKEIVSTAGRWGSRTWQTKASQEKAAGKGESLGQEIRLGMKRLGKERRAGAARGGGSELSQAALSGAGLVWKRAKGGSCQSKLVTCVCVCVCVCVCACACILIHVQLCGPVDCSLPCSSVHVILQARILEWVAILSSGGCSRPMY